MTRPAIDLDRLRAALRRMSRGDLLIVAERAAEAVPRTRLAALLGDRLRLEDFMGIDSESPSLLESAREFQAAAHRGDYYEDFDVDSKNFMQKSKGTEAFIAEFDRLLSRCVHAAKRSHRAPAREALEILFGLLRHIDECHDDVIFLADEPGSWQVGVDWRLALPAYFRCLAEGTPPEEFARWVDRTISDFADHERPRYLAAAHRVANAGQRTALLGLPAGVRHS